MEKQTVIALPKTADHRWLVASRLEQKGAESLVLDCSATDTMDSSVLCTIRRLHTLATKKQQSFVLRNISDDLLASLEADAKREPSTVDKSQSQTLEGTVFTRLIAALVSALSILAEMIYWGSFGLKSRRQFRAGSLSQQMWQLGYKAIGIVVLLSFLIGMVLALQAALQLKSYGAGIFLGPLIGITMIREMGPILTAVILAGRTGSATTAEIGTMIVGEEIDALRTMGINPIQFVVVPKFWAITITMPILVTLSSFAGIIGGYVVGFIYLDLPFALYMGKLIQMIDVYDVVSSLVKALVFSWLIIWIGSYFGFRVKGGAESVGRETTASVVACIFIIIIADALLSFIL